MMKILLPFLSLLVIYQTVLSSISLILIILFLASFWMKHDQDISILYSNLMWDTLSMVMINLSMLIIILMFLASIKDKMVMDFSKSYGLTLVSLLILLSIAFSSSNILMFYIFFEASLLPTFALILGWGNQPERTQAGVYMLLYTIFASLPLLLMIIILSSDMNLQNFMLVFQMNNSFFLTKIKVFFLMAAFLVKLPLYGVHLWLPKAHVEAPVAGSMILASILLKLGGYGVLRLLKLSQSTLLKMNFWMLGWALLGGAVVSLVCMMQNDIKNLIALSSVAHMSLMVSGIMTMSSWGLNGALFIMVGHAFCSSGLFFIANIMYSQIKTRSLFIMKGFKTICPLLTLWVFFLCTSNMAAPPSLNLLGEIHIILAVTLYSTYNLSALSVMTFLAACYSLYLYSQTQHGKLHSFISVTKQMSLCESLIAMMHWVPLNLLILTPWIFQMNM